MPQRMTDAEALMWSVEQHPHLSSTMGAVILLEAPPEPERLRAAVARLVAAVPRLRQRVVPPSAPLGAPCWSCDDAFDLEHHLRHVRLAPPGSPAQLRLLAAQTIADPFDRTRPLWQLVLVSGLRGGRAALLVKLHHAVADGTGALLMARHLVDLSPDDPPPAPVDLGEVFAEDRRREAAEQRPPVAEQLRRGAGLAARLVGEAYTAMADPSRVQQLGAGAVTTARAIGGQLPGGERRASALWRTRSRNRRLELVSLPLARARSRARQLGGTLNDLFVAAVLEGALGYHRHFGPEPAELTATIVLSTRSGGEGEASNAFLPSAVVLPGGSLAPAERVAAVRAALDATKERARATPDAVASLAGVASLLPAALTTGVALDQVARVDFATSNLRGLPVPVWVAGRRVGAVYPVGPVAGTAFNITLLSNLDELHLGLNIDPAAVSEPPLLAQAVAGGFAALGVPPHRTARGTGR